MKDLKKYIAEKLIVNKDYKIERNDPNDLCKIFDKYDKRKIDLNDGWGFAIHEKNIKDLWNNSRDTFMEMVDNRSKQEGIRHPEKWLEDGNVLATFIYHPSGMTVDSIIIFTAQLNEPWHGLKYITIAFSFFYLPEVVRVNATVRKTISRIHDMVGSTWIVPSYMILEIFDYIQDNDKAGALSYSDYNKIRDSLVEYIGEKLVVNKDYSNDTALIDFLNKFKWEQAMYSGNSSMPVENTFVTDKYIMDDLHDVCKALDTYTDKNDMAFIRYHHNLDSLVISYEVEQGWWWIITFTSGIKYTDDENKTFISFRQERKQDKLGTEINIISGDVFSDIVEKFDFMK